MTSRALCSILGRSVEVGQEGDCLFDLCSSQTNAQHGDQCGHCFQKDNDKLDEEQVWASGINRNQAAEGAEIVIPIWKGHGG